MAGHVDDDDVEDPVWKDDSHLSAWERDYERSWAGLQEDENGVLRIVAAEKRTKRQTVLDTRVVQRGLQRHLFVVLDCSAAMNDKDFKPTRLRHMQFSVEQFIKEYCDQNPISQLALIASNSAVANKLTELNSNAQRQIDALRELTCGGDVSLQNSLELAAATLRHVPKHGSREVLVVYGSYTTVDPGDIFETIARLRDERVRVSVVGIGAEVHVCRKLCTETGGTYGVARDEEHFVELLLRHTVPPPSSAHLRGDAALVQMGFPQRVAETFASFCACHSGVARHGGFYCPRCSTKVCELPTDCPVCGLTLVASPHLARSYHHLFPIPLFKRFIVAEPQSCTGCLTTLQTSSSAFSFACPRCRCAFCADCDTLIHEGLHNCPGCEAAGVRTT